MKKLFGTIIFSFVMASGLQASASAGNASGRPPISVGVYMGEWVCSQGFKSAEEYYANRAAERRQLLRALQYRSEHFGTAAQRDFPSAQNPKPMPLSF